MAGTVAKAAPLRRVVCLLAVAVAAGCATAPSQRPAAHGTRYWLPPASGWERAQESGLRLSRADRTMVFVPAAVVKRLVAAKKAVEQASGLFAGLAIVDEPLPNAIATSRNGTPLVALTAGWLEALGRDSDAIATTLGHEYAHIKLAHSVKARREREEAAATGTRIIGGILNAFVPFSGNVAGLAITGVVRGYTRDEERAADELGLRWATAAGYSACGRIRTMEVYRRAAAGTGGLSFLSTHPGADERIDYAKDVARGRGESCDR